MDGVVLPDRLSQLHRALGLLMLMSMEWLSEDVWSASWCRGLERSIWSRGTGGGPALLPLAECEAIVRVAREIGMIWAWPDGPGHRCPVLVPLAELEADS